MKAPHEESTPMNRRHFPRIFPRLATATTLGLALLAHERAASAQATPATSKDGVVRSEAWSTATNVLSVVSLATVTVMPRVFTSDPEVTTGWKARWHLSVLAPAMTLSTLALLNEGVLKESFQSPRPGCEKPGQPQCDTFGFLSTPSFVAGSALGQGVGTFLVDTFRWSHGSVHGGALLGQVGVPLVLAPLTTVGRISGEWESAGQAWGSALLGLGVGMGMGALYASMQRPECGYTGSLICW